MRQAIQQFRGATLGGWVALILTVLAGVADLFKFILNSSYAYGYPDFNDMLVDPITGFAFGVIVIMLCAYLVRGLLRRDVWPAVLSVAMMPFLYLIMLDGVTAAITHQENYYVASGNLLLVVEVLPSCLLVVIFGLEALANYHRKFRRLT